jgi:myo-inositol-1(or 4)-monophosphatase
MPAEDARRAGNVPPASGPTTGAGKFGRANEPARQPADLPAILQGMFEEVRGYLLNEGGAKGERVGTNPKGEATRAFDAEAEQRALAYARAHLPPFRVLSEESGEVRFGDGPPQYTLVIDPCDGSNNFRRGLRAVGFAIAVFPGHISALDPALATYAFVGDIFSGSVYTAARGGGAYLDGRPIHSSAITELRRAMLSINFGRVHVPTNPGDVDDPRQSPLPETVWRLVSQISTVRRIGATTLDLCYVAQGAFEGYVDLRSRLTPENFLAPALIIEEAGGCFVNEHGQPPGPVQFTTGYRVVAAGNRTLLDQVLQQLEAKDA